MNAQEIAESGHFGVGILSLYIIIIDMVPVVGSLQRWTPNKHTSSILILRQSPPTRNLLWSMTCFIQENVATVPVLGLPF
jgi:hypothetical protein